MSKWERNIAVPDIFEAVRIAALTNKSLGWLAGVPLTGRYLQYAQVRAALDLVHSAEPDQETDNDAPQYDPSAPRRLVPVG